MLETRMTEDKILAVVNDDSIYGVACDENEGVVSFVS
jgi:hypothetical protein